MHISALKVAFVVVIVFSVIVLALSSCGGGVSGPLKEMMKQTPDEVISFTYSNTKEMQDNTDLHSLLDKWKAETETQLAFFGIDRDKVEHYMEFVTGTGNDSIVIKGVFDIDNLRHQLESQDFDNKDFKLIELWESPDGQYSLAIPKDTLIGGPKEIVKESIRVINGGASLYDDQDARDIVDRLPVGVVVHYQEYAEEAPYDGLIAYGESLKKQSSEMMQVKMIYKFLEPEEATAAKEDVAEAVDEYYSKVYAEQDGRYLVLKAEVEIEDLL